MNEERPRANGHHGPAARLSDLDDEQLLAALRQLLSVSDPPPSWCVDLAKDSFFLRTADAELAALSEDSGLAGATVTRSADTRAGTAPRYAVFDADSLSVEIEVQPWLAIRLVAVARPAFASRGGHGQGATASGRPR